MIAPALWKSLLLGLGLVILAVLLTIWWRQQTYRWAIVLAICLIAAVALSWWSGLAFQVADYRAGCDGLCPGYRGAPMRTYRGEVAGGGFLAGMFALNSLVYLVLLLGWGVVVRAILTGTHIGLRGDRALPHGTREGGSFVGQALAGLLLLVGPFALAPLFLPPPEAHVRGDLQRIAINARREVYMYDQLASMPVLRVGLEDVRPRLDERPGMRVCLRTYTFFYLPTGHMYLDMTPEGVHSDAGGVSPPMGSCWE